MEYMTEDEKKEFHELCDRLLSLYEKTPQSGSLRKIIGGGDNEGKGNIIMFFQGTAQDAEAVRKFLNKRDT